MINLSLKKPVKISMDVPSGLEPDYETLGKLIDNIIIMAGNQKMSLDEVGKKYGCDFVVGKKNKYRADFLIEKTMYHLKIGYIKELTEYEASRSFAIPPKEKMMIKEAEKLAKEQVKEKQMEEKKKKGTRGKEVKKNEYRDLD